LDESLGLPAQTAEHTVDRHTCDVILDCVTGDKGIQFRRIRCSCVVAREIPQRCIQKITTGYRTIRGVLNTDSKIVDFLS
jgi:hypothetical protein